MDKLFMGYVQNIKQMSYTVICDKQAQLVQTIEVTLMTQYTKDRAFTAKDIQ